MPGTKASRITGSAIVAAVVVALLSVGWQGSIGASGADPLATVRAIQTRQAADRNAAEEDAPQQRIPAATSPTPATAPVEWKDIGEGLDLYYYFATSGLGELYLLAEIRNNNDQAVTTPSLLFTLLDDDGNIVGETRPIALYPIVEPEQTTPRPFWVTDVQPDSWASELFEVVGFGSGITTCSTGLELRDIA